MYPNQIIQLLQSTPLEPRQFLRYSFGIDKLSPEEILEEELNFSYGTKCVNLLSKLLGFRKQTIRSWGDNPHFWNMPKHSKIACIYAQIALSQKELQRVSYEEYVAPRITALEFIEATILNDSLPSKRIKILTSTNFRGNCLKLLSETLAVSERTIYEWGRDIEFGNMPKYHEHTLAYALAACCKRQNLTLNNNFLLNSSSP